MAATADPGNNTSVCFTLLIGHAGRGKTEEGAETQLGVFSARPRLWASSWGRFQLEKGNAEEINLGKGGGGWGGRGGGGRGGCGWESCGGNKCRKVS